MVSSINLRTVEAVSPCFNSGYYLIHVEVIIKKMYIIFFLIGVAVIHVRVI